MLGFAAAGCSRSELRECEGLLEEGSFEAAARRCEAWYSSSADPESGAAAAEALLELGRYDEVLAWTARLRGTPVEGRLLRVAATARARSGDREGSLSAFRECADRRREAGELVDAARCAYAGFYAAWQLAQHRVAFELAAQSFEDAARAGEPRFEAQALGGLYTAFYEVGDLASARRALEAWERLTPADQRLARAGIRMNQGLLRQGEGRLQLALESFESAIALAESESATRFWRFVHLNHAQTLL
jgi:tetratricopeptide (TPR) repeat protein